MVQAWRQKDCHRHNICMSASQSHKTQERHDAGIKEQVDETKGGGTTLSSDSSKKDGRTMRSPRLLTITLCPFLLYQPNILRPCTTTSWSLAMCHVSGTVCTWETHAMGSHRMNWQLDRCSWRRCRCGKPMHIAIPPLWVLAVPQATSPAFRKFKDS
jgi:hypothetical protein